jgi:23S rRNA (uracil1939-C5)-methyltransferase
MVEADIVIERLCYGGAGLGRLEGKACFVPFSAPGDRVRFQVVKEKKSFIEGRLVAISEPSQMRVAPACPAFGTCGGCDWQHLPYAEQLRHKGEIFADALRRTGRVAGEVVQPVVASPCAYGYRTRIQLKVAHRGGSPKLGFFQAGSHQVVDIPFGCAIAAPHLNRIAAEFRALLPKLPGVSALSQIDLSLGDDDSAIAVLQVEEPGAAALAKALLAARDALASVRGLFLRTGARSRIEPVFGIDALSYRIPEGLLPGSPQLALRFGRGGFSQVNYPQNLALISTVYQMAQLAGSERVLDLYCGNGNFSLPLARYAAEIVGVEGYAPSIEDARRNARENGIENVNFLVSDVAVAVQRFAAAGERFDLVLLDPPRSGAESVARLADLAADRIIYVSCDPPTLARDLAHLGEQGYRVVTSQPVDMFPQTYHLESVTLLRRF